MEYKSLGSLVKFVGGYSFKSEKYVPSGLRVIRIANVQDGVLEDNAPCYYPIEYKDMIADALLKEGDLLMSLTGNVGRVAFMTDEFLPAGLNQRVECFRTDDDIMKKYLFYMFRSKTFIQEALKNATGVAQLNMSTTWLKDYMVPIRGSNEMNSIIKTLDSIESAILSEKNAILSYDSLIKSRFNEMFSNLDDYVTVQDSCEVHARIGWQALTQKEHMKTGKYMLITGTDFKDNEINYSSCVFVTKERYEMDRHIILRNDDVLITKDGTIGKVAIVHNLPGPATLNSGVFVLRPDNRFNKEYISYVFKGEPFSRFVEEVKTGVTVKHLNQANLLKFKIPVPKKKDQEHFALFLKTIDKLKFINKK